MEEVPERMLPGCLLPILFIAILFGVVTYVDWGSPTELAERCRHALAEHAAAPEGFLIRADVCATDIAAEMGWMPAAQIQCRKYWSKGPVAPGVQKAIPFMDCPPGQKGC